MPKQSALHAASLFKGKHILRPAPPSIPEWNPDKSGFHSGIQSDINNCFRELISRKQFNLAKKPNLSFFSDTSLLIFPCGKWHIAHLTAMRGHYVLCAWHLYGHKIFDILYEIQYPMNSHTNKPLKKSIGGYYGQKRHSGSSSDLFRCLL